ncbi:hypothetical protein AVEN_79992-1 [Araneus ventricosus]|uniref:Uncharacterized protein n=1 Tax=Araneus ventricosus TaxID=182803 RepID=A0A4Y2FPQ6_ARAVE|nr:hypothetical protein AVEN_79992-1 [Araneus ventricosus]
MALLGQQRFLVVQLGYSTSWVGQRITLVAPNQSALLGQQRVQVGQLDILLPGMNSGAFLVAPRQYAGSVTTLLGQQRIPVGKQCPHHRFALADTVLLLLSQKLSLQKSVLPPYTSHFESPGEGRQATPNCQIFKTGKGTVRIKTFLAKESQPCQLEPQWKERALTAHILPNQNEAALSLTKERVSTLIGKKGDFKKFIVPNPSKGKGRRRVKSIWSTSCLTRFFWSK